MKTVRSLLFTLALAVLLAAPASADVIASYEPRHLYPIEIIGIVLAAAVALLVIGLLVRALLRRLRDRRGGKK